MATKDKKMNMASRMYDQNSKGGKGESPKYKQTSKSEGKEKMKTAMNGKGTGKGGGQGYAQSDAKGSFVAKYNQ